MSNLMNLYPCVLGAYRAGQRAGYDLAMDEALKATADMEELLTRYAVYEPQDIPYHGMIQWPIERSDKRIVPILSAAFRLGALLAVWHGVARSTRTPSKEYFENRRDWDNYGRYLLERLVAKLLDKIGEILESTAQEQRAVLARKLPWYARKSYLAKDAGAFQSARTTVFNASKKTLTDELASHIDRIVRRPNAAMIDFGEALLRELCASIAPSLDPEVFLETVFYAPNDVVEMFVAAYFRECIANSPLRDRQQLWRPDLTAVGRRVFVVHGRDLDLRDRVVELLEESNYSPVVIQRDPNRGATIMEKLESASTCFYAVVVLTPDDYGGLKAVSRVMAPSDTMQARARQNVIFELGWFMALLGRDRVCCIVSGDLEVPSDVHGLAYYKADDIDKIVGEIKAIEDSQGRPNKAMQRTGGAGR